MLKGRLARRHGKDEMHLARRSAIDWFCSSYVAKLVDYAEMASANLLRFVELGVHEPETVLCFETVKAEPFGD